MYNEMDEEESWHNLVQRMYNLFEFAWKDKGKPQMKFRVGGDLDEIQSGHISNRS
jgi:hypothetical protein